MECLERRAPGSRASRWRGRAVTDPASSGIFPAVEGVRSNPDHRERTEAAVSIVRRRRQRNARRREEPAAYAEVSADGEPAVASAAAVPLEGPGAGERR